MKLLLNVLLIAICVFSFSQNYTSINNGNWTDPTTWSPTGVPVTFASVTINHDVIMNTDFGYSSGVITINQSGSLVQDVAGRSFAINGGSLEIYGRFDIDIVGIYSGSLSNEGIAYTKKAYNNGTVWNYGLWDNIDSLYNDNEIYNDYGEIYVDNFFNASYFRNDGYTECIDFYNDSFFENFDDIDIVNFYNADTTFNNGLLTFYDHTNAGYLENYYIAVGYHDFTNAGDYENYGLLSVDNDFMNADSVNFDAFFFNDSAVYAGNNFLNVDTIYGTIDGHFCVVNNSANSGYFYGEFDFCDQTPPSTPPYIDINTGYIDSTITYCLYPCGTNINQADFNNDELKVYPNPAYNLLFINYNETIKEIKLYDINGKVVLTQSPYKSNTEININKLNQGLYFINVITQSGIKTGKIIIE
ncbi:MAG: hypothetical protein Kow0068_11460 [Marinilabiliales bacterium]